MHPERRPGAVSLLNVVDRSLFNEGFSSASHASGSQRSRTHIYSSDERARSAGFGRQPKADCRFAFASAFVVVLTGSCQLVARSLVLPLL